MVHRQRKNFLPTVLFSLLCWSVVAFFFFFVDPELIRDFPVPGAYFPFFFFIFIALFLTFSLLLAHSRRGLLLSLGVITFLYLRLIGLGYALNAILLFAFLVFFELAISNRA